MRKAQGGISEPPGLSGAQVSEPCAIQEVPPSLADGSQWAGHRHRALWNDARRSQGSRQLRHGCGDEGGQVRLSGGRRHRSGNGHRYPTKDIRPLLHYESDGLRPRTGVCCGHREVSQGRGARHERAWAWQQVPYPLLLGGAAYRGVAGNHPKQLIPGMGWRRPAGDDEGIGFKRQTAAAQISPPDHTRTRCLC